MKIIYPILFLFLLISNFCQAASITFEVNMSYQQELGIFNPNTEFVDVAGTFNGWEGSEQLADPDGDLIYTITIDGFSIGENIAFKFRQNGLWDGTEEFSGGGPNRVYTVAAETNLLAFWYDDAVSPDGAPIANFSVNDTKIYEDAIVEYFDNSGGEVNSRTWFFEGGTPATSNLERPRVRYMESGNYRTQLIITGSNGSDTLSIDNYIEVQERDFGEAEWWNTTVFYEIFVRSFYDSDGDGVGDFNGLTEKLDYLNDGDPNTDTDLGIKGIWLMPIHESPSYHGYDVMDYKSINPDYGTLEDFQNFLDAAHARGIKVIIDFVMNHSSTQHPWFQDASSSTSSEKRNWYRWSTTNPGYNGPWGQQVWHGSSTGFYYGLFWGGMPDLNYNEPAVTDAIFDAADFWLEDIGIDGFRVDAVKYIKEEGTILEDTEGTFNFFKDFRTHFKAVNPESFAVGEAWTSTNKVLPYVEDDGLDFCFEFDLAYSILDAVNNGNGFFVGQQLQKVYNVYPHLQYGTFLSNHDQNRIMNIFNNDEEKIKAAAAIYLTAPGVPFLYYGEEIGMNGEKPDEFIRRPMQWTSAQHAGFSSTVPWINLNSNYPIYNVATQEQEANSMLNWYKKLIQIRNNEEGLQLGNYKTVLTNQPAVLSFVRSWQGESYLVMINTSGNAVNNLDINLDFNDLPAGTYTAEELVSGNMVELELNTFNLITGQSLGAYSTKVFKFMNPTNVEVLHSDRVFTVFPNPVQGQLFIQTTELISESPNYTLTDVLGRIVQQGTLSFSGLQARLEVSSIVNGTYFLNIEGRVFQLAISN